MAIGLSSTHIEDVEAGGAIPPEGHHVYYRDTDNEYISDGSSLMLIGSGGGSYTDEMAQDAVGGIVDTTLVYNDATPSLGRAALTGDVTAATNSNATVIANDAVTFAKFQNITDNRLLGRSAGSTGDMQEITVGQGLLLNSGSIRNTGIYGILDYKSTTDTPDDDFNSTTIDAKWTVVTGAVGTVDLFEVGTTVAKYDLTTRPGWMLFQVGKNSGNILSIRQDYTLPDGKSIVAAMSLNTAGTSAGGATNNSLDFGIMVNDDNSGISTGLYAGVYVDAQPNTGPRPFMTASGGSSASGPDGLLSLGDMVYLRISRVGLTYHHYVSSGNGACWYFVGSKTLASACDNVWMWSAMDATITGTVPIIGCDWIRLGTNSLDPW